MPKPATSHTKFFSESLGPGPHGSPDLDARSYPTQTVSASGQVNVNISQFQTNAILSWNSFNVGARTTLTFDQQGNTNWVALNRVVATAPRRVRFSATSSPTARSW
ncbi:MAG: hypothetical protein WDN50_06370 [Bradyrhizobium sp.]